ncbi:hypothetical protein [Streptomyces sp. NBC_01637]|uniref:hypothetical protein n=1 Tax=unclassified Streptomyces TaxID=2593676 RepID=UPI00386560A7|nr:hypothetical protein OH719_00965 [Streptomyces sp. NBC_01653]WTC84501.1 hypothetical protein OH719_45905 [Streptomyces sp. NBC_01653]WTD86366.1 hypothetical protein OG891_00965 [Streptomyces sp. NBC_01637]WTD94158.1 hypothetical protein OG891_45900 [Streptomyces sp. NBC_01637]
MLQYGVPTPVIAGQLRKRNTGLHLRVSAGTDACFKLATGQQWLLENVLGLSSAGEDERPVKRTQANKWALNMKATVQVPPAEGEPERVEEARRALGRRRGLAVKLGTFLDNARRRADRLTLERRQALTSARAGHERAGSPS